MNTVYLALFLTAASAPAAEMALQFDPAQTEIKWTLAGNVHTVHGTFKLKRGTLRFDPTTGKASGEIVVDALSGESGSGARDKKMHKDVLQTAQFAEAVFTPDRFDGQLSPDAPSKLSFHGALKLHGADHELTLETQVEPKAPAYAATAKFSVPYVKWGMKNPSFFAFKVADTVEVEIKTLAR